MKEVIGLVAAIAGAVGAVTSCADKSKQPPQSVTQEQKVVVVPPLILSSPPGSHTEVLSPSTNVVSSVIASYQELMLLNKTQIQGDNGASAEMRLEDARERVRLANYIAQNAHLLEQLVSTNPDIRDCLEEVKKLPDYQKELVRLSALAQK